MSTILPEQLEHLVQNCTDTDIQHENPAKTRLVYGFVPEPAAALESLEKWKKGLAIAPGLQLLFFPIILTKQVAIELDYFGIRLDTGLLQRIMDTGQVLDTAARET